MPDGFHSNGDKIVACIFDNDGFSFSSEFTPTGKKAAKPEDIRIIAVVEKRREEAGSYAGGGIASIQIYAEHRF